MNRPVTIPPVYVSVDLAREPDFQLGTLQIQPSIRRAVCGAHEEAVQPRVMQVLVVLARAKGGVVSREELIEVCWDGAVVGDDSITRCIAKIRQLADCGGTPAFDVETIPRVGYRLVRVDAPLQPVSFPPAGKRWSYVVPAMLAVVIAGAVGAAYWTAHTHPKTAVSRATTPVIAVLPLTPLYADPKAQMFADGISTNIASTLSNTGLEVVDMEQSLRFRGAAKAAAARALGVPFLVDGEISREAGLLKAAIHVDDARHGMTLLTQTFEAPAEDGSLLSDRMTAFVASALGWEAALKALAPENSQDPRVTAGFLLAIKQGMLSNDTRAAYTTARGLVRLAPDNALAQVTLAAEAAFALPFLPRDERNTALAESRAAAKRTVELDPQFPDVYIALSRDTPYGQWSRREMYLRNGLSIDRDALGLLVHLASFLEQSGQIRAAESLIQQMTVHSGLLAMTLSHQAEEQELEGRTVQAVRLLRRAIRLWPEDGWLLAPLYESLAFSGQLAEADSLLRDLASDPVLAGSAHLRIPGELDRALRTRQREDIDLVIRDCAGQPRELWNLERNCLIGMTLFGRLDDAYRFARPMYPDQHSTSVTFVNNDVFNTEVLFLPQMAPFRADPRFIDLTKRVGLFDYWVSRHRMPDFCTAERAPICQALKAA